MANTAENSEPTSVVNAPVFDWSTTPLAHHYNGFYLKVLDDLFTSEECAALIALAESDDNWKQAAVHYGLGPHENFVNTDYRNSERILRFDHEASGKLYQRLLPYVQELVEIKGGGEWEGIVGQPGDVSGTWKLVGYVHSFRLKRERRTNNIFAASMSALASCVMNQDIFSEAIVMAQSNSQTDESPALLFKSIWAMMQMWKVVLHGFLRTKKLQVS
jgi:hypothetical protein